MNASVLAWWFLGDPLKWISDPQPTPLAQDSRYILLKTFNILLNTFYKLFHKILRFIIPERLRNILHRLFTSVKNRRRQLEKILFVWADTQTVTGIALAIAGIVHIKTMPLYHIAVLSDLLTISADGQAVVLIYAFVQLFTQEHAPAPGQAHDIAAAPPTRLWYKRIWMPRALISAAYISIYLAFAAKALERFDNADKNQECLLNYSPQFGNYGGWTMGEVVVTLLFNILAFAQVFVPVEILRKWWLKGALAALLPIYITIIYAINLADIVSLRQANKPTLNDGTGENVISSFGQVVPLVMILLVVMSLWSLFDDDQSS